MLNGKISEEKVSFMCDKKNPLWLTLSQTIPGFYVTAIQVFENTVGKREIAQNEQFLLFPVFSTHLEKFMPFL